MAIEQKIKERMLSFKGTITTAVTTAFGFIIALFWRDAIKAWIDNLLIKFQLTGTGYIYSIIAAIIVTIIGTIIICLIARWNKNTT